MALNIKNERVVALIRRLADERKVDLTEAIRLAVQHELERGEARHAPRRERLRAIANRIAASPIRDPRPVDELLGYDEYGLPE